MIQGLDRARWVVLDPLLDEALELSPDERPTWVEGLRARDAALAADIEELLSEYGRVAAEDFLASAPEPLATLAGQSFGAYTLRAPIGRGGMGSVWLAHRSDGRFDAAVAVKILNASLMGPGAEGRFRREGSILARLRHRHIAQLLDAGVSVAGQPYLVLELVDGEHIGRHCDEKRLTVEARVRLFLDVLAAVAHAHANLVVHRDLKPSNVLVDRDGVVKLLDFGIAKLLANDADAGTVTLTIEGGGALTPAYAAPEQLQGADVTTATDVFALGVLLYELLAGRHPAGDAVRASPVELIRVVLDREPPRLSEEPGDPAQRARLESRAADRGTSPDALRRALRGDLETIVAKALKRDPAERYASASAFADDLRAFLEHAPIGARPDTFGYRARKFARRHRLPVALGSVVLLSLAGGLAGTTWQARAAARERDLARDQAQRAESLNLFTEYMLSQAVPGGQPLTARDIMKRGEALAGKRAAHDPALAVDVLVGLGTTYAQLEEPDNVDRTLGQAYALAQTVADPATRAQASCAWARALDLHGDLQAAQRAIDEGLALTSDDERFDAVVATCLVHRAAIVMSRGTPEQVLDAARRALARLDRRPGSHPELRASVLQMVAQGQSDVGDRAAADRTFAAAFDQLRVVGRDEASDAAVLLNNWAVNTVYTDPTAALEKYGRSMALFGGPDSDTVSLPGLYNYAAQLNRLSRPREARPVIERMQALAEQHGHARGTTMAALQMAYACTTLGDLACARASLRTAEAGIVSFPQEDRARADLAREKAQLAIAEGRDADAHALLVESLALYQPVTSESLTIVDTLIELSRLELRLGATAEAEGRARAALDAAEGYRGGATHSSWVGRSLLALAAARETRGDTAGARTLLAQALEHMVPTLGAGHPDVVEARRRLSR